MRGGELAVACRDGVVLWKLAPTISSAFNADPSQLQIMKPVVPSLRLLSCPALSELTALAFQPSGNYLAVGGTSSSVGPADALCIWDLDIGSFSMVGGGLGGGTSRVAWSADGLVLVQACTGPILRIFETVGWSHSVVKLDSPCVALAICPDSRTILYATAALPAVQMLVLRAKGRTDVFALEDRLLALDRRVGKRAGKDITWVRPPLESAGSVSGVEN